MNCKGLELGARECAHEESERHPQGCVGDREQDDEPDRALHVEPEQPERNPAVIAACTAATAANAIP